MSTIKFQKFYVTDGRTRARVSYSLDNRADGRKCVTLYAKDYTDALRTVFGPAEYRNDTDTQTDYFDKGRVVLFEESPDYAAARERAEAVVLGLGSKLTARQQADVAAFSAPAVGPVSRDTVALRADAVARMRAALTRTQEAQDGQDWTRVRTLLLLAVEALDAAQAQEASL
jgi:hypothetical protein